MKFNFRGSVSTGFGEFPVEDEFEVSSSAEALQKAQSEAERMFLIERNPVKLTVFDGENNYIGEVRAPSDDLARPTRRCEMHGCEKAARYRECYYDSSMEVCEDHLDEEEHRRERYNKNILVELYDIQRKIPLHPVTLEPFK